MISADETFRWMGRMRSCLGEWRTFAVMWACAGLIAIPTVPGWPHAGLAERIAAITQRLTQEGASADLYLQRAELYRLHGDWTAAEADYRRAAARAPQLPLVAFYHGRMLLASGRPEAACKMLDGYLSHPGGQAEAYLVRARALKQLGDPLAAARDYDRALKRIKHPSPAHFLERARALALAGPAYIDEALQGLAQGIERFGPLASLHRFALELEMTAGRYEAGLKRLEMLIAHSTRKERWLAEYGHLLLLAGRPRAARQALQQALASLDDLPPHRRRVRATAAFEELLREQLDDIEARSCP